MDPTQGNQPNKPTQISSDTAALNNLSISRDQFPQSLEIHPPRRRKGFVEVSWVSPHNDPLTGEGASITFLIESDTTDFSGPAWEEGVKQKLIEMGAYTLEDEIAKNDSPFACKFFQKIAANYEFASIWNCTLSGSDIPILRVNQGHILNFTIKDAVVGFHVSSDSVICNLTCENSHLRMFCEDNDTPTGFKVDESSYLSGSFKGSTFGDNCQIHGYAINADFTDTIWECEDLSDLAERLDGMRFSWDHVPEDPFKQIAEDLTIDSLSKDFERLNQRFSDQNLDMYFDHLRTDWKCEKIDEVQPTSPLLIQEQVNEVMRLEILSEQKCTLEISKDDNSRHAGSLIIEDSNVPGDLKDVYPSGFAHRAEAVDALLDVLVQKQFLDEHLHQKKNTLEEEIQRLREEAAKAGPQQSIDLQDLQARGKTTDKNTADALWDDIMYQQKRVKLPRAGSVVSKTKQDSQ
ncbi:MAG: hypothetical protein GX589_01410 [Deltaproteobacteria bacterium]|nr:hypothetical protein [Deltaproteobacteria bacterium]